MKKISTRIILQFQTGFSCVEINVVIVCHAVVIKLRINQGSDSAHEGFGGAIISVIPVVGEGIDEAIDDTADVIDAIPI